MNLTPQLLLLRRQRRANDWKRSGDTRIFGRAVGQTRRLGVKYGHRLMYVQRKQALRKEMIYFVDKRAAFSTQASRAIAVNAIYWAAPIVGAGESVLLEKLGATG